MERELLNTRFLILSLLLFVSYSSQAVNVEGEIITALEINQQKYKTITGVIFDSNKEPVIGANIIEKGTSNGTVTDYDGKFTLNVSNNAVLKVSYIGYHEQEIATLGQTVFNITLVEDTKTLDELVVVGYGSMKKSDLTGALSQVSGED